MELCFFISILLSPFFIAVVKLLFTTPKLPPGPPKIPFLGNPSLLLKPFFNLELLLRDLHAKYGPIVTLHIGFRSLIFVSDHSLAHKALVQKGSVFSDRLPAVEANKIHTSNQHTISSARYGPLWRLLRRNLMSEILHPSQIKSFAQGRNWVLQILIKQLRNHADLGEPICVLDHFQYATFSLLLLMCFGQKLDQKVVKPIQRLHKRMLLSFLGINVFSLLPKIGRIIFRNRWNEFLQMKREQHELLIPLIRAHNAEKQDENRFPFSYLDSLLRLEHPNEGGRKLTEGEIITLCSEFMNGGSETTATALQWIMANLVKHQDMQEKLVEEMKRVVGKEAEEVRAEDLDGLPYLKAVVMEGLRRHPPFHFVLPHTVLEEVEFEGHVIPTGVAINFTVAEMGRDEKVWKEPMAFRPERFLNGGEELDITGSREIKMMPFGAGRRICPGINLAMLHLEYFVANLVREFEWKPVDGEEIDLSEVQEFTVVMKTPLKAKIFPRGK